MQGTLIEMETSPKRSPEKQLPHARSISNFHTSNRTKMRAEVRGKRASEEIKQEMTELKPLRDKRANQSLTHIRVRSEAEL